MIQLTQVKPAPIVSLGINPASDVFGVDRTLEQGKNYLVVAPSGRGKSTFLHLLYGLRKDFEGRVLVDEREVAALDPNQLAEIRQEILSIVFQDLRLFPQLTALENIQLKASLTGKQTDGDIQSMAERLEVDHVLEKAASTLSYGQQQRVAIIRALCQPFDYLLLDEPFSHLDTANTRQALDLIREACSREGAGLILTSLGEQYDITYETVLEV